MLEEATELIGLQVYTPNGIFLGSVNNLVIDLENKKVDGMFISETGEAMYSGIPARTYSQSTVTYSNELFARLVAEKIHAPLPELHAHLLDRYQPKGCPIIRYNRERLELIESAAASAKRSRSAALLTH